MNSIAQQILRLAFLASFVCVSSSATADDQRVEAGPPQFSERVAKILSKEPKGGYLDDELFEQPLMTEVLRDPERFLPQVETFLIGGRDLSQTEVRVSLLSMQCLPLTKYLAFVDRLSAQPGGQLNEWVLFSAVAPGFEASTRLATSFREAPVRKALQRVTRSPNASQRTREAVSEILDGITAQAIKHDKWTPILKCKQR